MLRNVEKRGVQAARLPLEPGGTGSKLSYRSQHAQRSGERDRAGSSHTCLRRIAAGRKLGLFSCSIPPSFVLSRNMSMVNTTSNSALFGAFWTTAGPEPRAVQPIRGEPGSAANRQAFASPYCLAIPRDLHDPQIWRYAGQNRSANFQRPSVLSRHTEFTTRLFESCERLRNLVSSLMA